jgi:DNA-binding NarL/FixJ family response regulator
MNNSCIAYLGRMEGDEYWIQMLSKSLADYGEIQTYKADEIGQVRQSACQFRLVIVDSGGVADVLQVVTAMRKELPLCKILVMTGAPLWKEVRQAIYAGADDYCQKTLDQDGIVEHVEALIGKKAKGVGSNDG